MIHIRTTKHPSGRYTCEKRTADENLWKDLDGELFGNLDKAVFYKAVSELLDSLISQGRLASYDDMAAKL